MPGKPDEARREQARNLRRQGHSLSQIATTMGLKSAGGVLGRWLKGVPPPEWTKRPRAKDGIREEAVRLRRQGRSYREIEKILGVSKSSLSLWLKDVPLTAEHRQALSDRWRDVNQRRADSIHAASRARHQGLIDEAAAQIGPLSERDLFLAGVVAYWAEGSKTKPWGSRRSVDFTNSDPHLVTLFLLWLRLMAIPHEDLTFRLHIHETADVNAALRFWSKVVDVPPNQFLRTTLKHHNPRTNRKNVGREYRGCLVVRVRRSLDLNARIEGWFRGLVGNATEEKDGASADLLPMSNSGILRSHSRMV
ncbi:MAG: helix-turn-helix domain-containing protein [Actinomycetota bacterium]